MLCHGEWMPRHARQCHASMPCVLMRIHVMCCRLHACIPDFRVGVLLDLQVPCRCLNGYHKRREGSQAFRAHQTVLCMLYASAPLVSRGLLEIASCPSIHSSYARWIICTCRAGTLTAVTFPCHFAT